MSPRAFRPCRETSALLRGLVMMQKTRWISRVFIAIAALTASVPSLSAQGVTTGSITGVVTDETGQTIEAAQIQVVSRSTGVTAGALSRADGKYTVHGLETGGPYTVSIRRIG